jgi:hypothetical protein
MPALKLRPQKLQCAFCSMISTRGTGLSAHVRAQHPREYGKWNKNPNRLLEAAAAVAPQEEPKRNRRLRPVRSAAPVEFGEVAVPAQPNQQQPILLTAPALQTGENDVHEALSLIQKAYEQLSTRKQTIESELARIEGLRGEHEAVTAQVAALDQAMKAFHRQPLQQPKTA